MDFDAEGLDIQKNTYLKDEFEKNLEQKIKDELKIKTNQEIEVDVVANTDKEIIIESINIKPYKEEYANIIKEYLGTGENGAQIR